MISLVAKRKGRSCKRAGQAGQWIQARQRQRAKALMTFIQALEYRCLYKSTTDLISLRREELMSGHTSAASDTKSTADELPQLIER
ncbi:hypothetical protein JQR85_03100 [Stutzerimonas urumqiensis]|uniref:hypothetical protein n=1 Tax=Stutzerimonas urumqiensis TaxID=638269 RepID=UPI003DA6C3D6